MGLLFSLCTMIVVTWGDVYSISFLLFFAKNGNEKKKKRLESKKV